jgi:hypothetical protein
LTLLPGVRNISVTLSDKAWRLKLNDRHQQL